MASDAGEHEGSAALRPHELGIGRLFESVRDAIVVADASEGRVVLWNPAAAEIFGYPPEEALGMLVEEIVPEHLRARHRAGLERYWETGHGRFIDSGTALELPAVRRSGEEITIELTLSPISRVQEEEEAGRYVLAIIRDVTARVRSEKEVRRLQAELERRVEERTRRLERSEERYRAVVEQSTEGIYFLDAGTGRILDTNPSLREMLGYTAEEMRGMSVYDLIAHPKEDVDANLELTLREGRRLVGERRYRRRDGTLLDVEVGASTIRYDGRDIVCAVVRDVTGRKRAEETLREVRGAERTRMARDLHDGPLQDLAYAMKEIEIVQALSGDPELEERLGMAIEALARAGRDLRSAVYDLRRGDEQSSPFPRLLEALVESNRSMMHGCEVALEADGDLPSAPLGGTGTELLRILQEALSNVRRHAAARRVRVRVGMEGGAVVAEVADDGRGFPPGTQPGVGFRSMRERTEALGGELEVESGAGEGTRVRVRVPLPGCPRGSGVASPREHAGRDAER